MSNLISMKSWTGGRSAESYAKIAEDIKRIMMQVSVDIKIGYLTKQKINRATKKISKTSEMAMLLGKKMIMLSGKAGTGKTSELTTLLSKHVLNNGNALFITYNRLLTFDLAMMLNNIFNVSEFQYKSKMYSVTTIHKQLYNISKKLGILSLVSNERIEEITGKFIHRISEVEKIINKNEFNKYMLTNYEVYTNFFDMEYGLNNPTKKIAIELFNFASRKNKNLVNDLDEILEDYKKSKLKIIKSVAKNNSFNSDYYNVLQLVYDAIDNPSNFWKVHNLIDKGELLKEDLNLNEEDLIEFKEGRFVEKRNRKIGNFRKKRILFIDEAQDCHRLEKEIFLKIFNKENIVVANGGVEQLIRHNELCNWEYSFGTDLQVAKFRTQGKSLRIKNNLLELCKYVAKKYKIQLDIEPFNHNKNNQPDLGEIIFDFRSNLQNDCKCTIIKTLTDRGYINGCTPYEAVLIMVDTTKYKSNSAQLNFVVDEYDDVDVQYKFEKEGLTFKDSLKNEYNIDLWDDTVDDKKANGLPLSNQLRAIFYDSCRGLEAWSTINFSLDRFFDKKYSSKESEEFLTDFGKSKQTQDMFIPLVERKKMYAATWVLMVLTRAIDTLYINIEDKESEFGKTVIEFIESTSQNVKIID